MNPAFTQFMESTCLALGCEIPEFPTQMGLFEIAGEPVPQHYFAGIDPESVARRQDLLQDIGRQLRTFPRELLSESERLSAGILDFLVEYAYERGLVGTAGKDFLQHDYLIRPAVGLQSELPLFLADLHPVRHEADARDYVSRLRNIATHISAATQMLYERKANGCLPPALVLQDTIAEIESFIACSPEENVLFLTLNDKSRQLQDLDEPSRNTLLQETLTEITGSTYPAYQQLLLTLRELVVGAEESPGLWRLPEGEAWYEFLLRSATTTSYSAQEIHELGLEETNRLEKEIIRACADSGINAKNIGDCHRALDAHKTAPLEDTEYNRQAIVDRVKALIEETEACLPGLFHRLPRGRVTVRPIPQFAEASRNQSYQPPSLDGSRAGFFELNVGQLLDQSEFEIPILVYHEIFPGHHLQMTLAQETDSLPSLRRIITFDAYIEGWAKYAEMIPSLHGINNDPRFHLARMRRELISTINLALDTGIHAKQWSVEHAIRFFQEHSGMGASFSRYIVHRSASVPAQMCSYKIGMMKMVEQRKKMEQAAGAAFDARDFHDTVLRHGAVPLALLESIVDREIEKDVTTRSDRASRNRQ